METVDTISVPTGSTALESETVSVTLEPPSKKARTEESVLWKCLDDTVQSTNVDNQQERSTNETQLTQISVAASDWSNGESVSVVETE